MTNRNYETGILITGAAGGLGKALVANAVTMPGIDTIIAADISPVVLKLFRSEKVLPVVMDAGDENSVASLAEKIKSAAVKIKYIVNNAGVFTLFPVSESSAKMLDALLKVNVYGPIFTVGAFLDDLEQTQGRVVQISSDSVRLPTLFQPYPASKISLEAFSIAMRQELALLGIKLIMVRPGAMDTNLLKNISQHKNPVQNSRFGKHFDVFAKLALKDVGKTVNPDIVAKLVIKALTVAKPRLIYRINTNGKISSLKLFPQRMIDKLILKTLQ